MFAKPQEEHRWLEQLSGEWTFDSEAVMAPGEAAHKVTGRAVARMLGGLWSLIETTSTGADGAAFTTLMTLGFNPDVGTFVGSFIGSMMTKQWLYSGTLDASRRVLTLDTIGPKLVGTGDTHYQDIVEIVDADHWLLRSRVLMDDGSWNDFMTAHHRRIK